MERSFLGYGQDRMLSDIQMCVGGLSHVLSWNQVCVFVDE